MVDERRYRSYGSYVISMGEKTVLVTGASRGIGQATAELFYQQGYNVVLVSRTASEIRRPAA